MGRFFCWMLRSDTRAMGRVLDVVWYDVRAMDVYHLNGRASLHCLNI